ncbi:hypothetical protein EC973_008036 [Apophysomyces ossiformis]|uniref:Mitochondrial import inner membrane translocase subunit TIM50 n=1 Tax=Apophysomyces ossiformis TaxID=679940 RepID=A0A8H7ER97_9FUNG|nr:hypothetical protein EC973_008036 [Apophysomyces ossiformis]
MSSSVSVSLRAASRSSTKILKPQPEICQRSLLPSEAYMAMVAQPSMTLTEPAKHLLILDLNGTLASRTKRKNAMYIRPYQDLFFDTIFRDFTVMVWSSAQPTSVDNMCRMFGPYNDKLKLRWDRRDFGLTAKEYHQDSLTLKDMEKVWEVLKEYDATNTILLDDSPIKSSRQPYNSIHLRTFSHTDEDFLRNGECELLNVLDYLEALKYQSNVCHYMKNQPYVSLSSSKNKKDTRVYFYSFSEPKDVRTLCELYTKKGI